MRQVCVPIILAGASQLTVTPVAAAESPRLVLQITVDGLRNDLLMRSADQFGEGGFRYLLDEGAVYANAHYQHANTETIVGHATLATGAHPSAHGMTGNIWYDEEADALTYNVEDPDHPLLPTGEIEQTDVQLDPAQRKARTSGRSPRAILAETFADKLLSYTGGRAKVFAVSGKDRGAIPMAGRGGVAYWYSTNTGDFVTSTWYVDAYPDWVSTWNAARRVDAHSESLWELLADESTYRLAHQDDRPYEADLRGYGRTFPHRFASLENPLFFTQILISPVGDQLVSEFAKSLIANESIGTDDVPDYLALSFSGVDAVNHFFGASSLETEDMVRQLDGTLADLFAFIDSEVGLEHTLVVLSADHGMVEAPEYMAERGFDAGRLTTEDVLESIDRFVNEEYGLDGIVEFNYRHFVHLEKDRIVASGLDPEVVQEAVAAVLTREPGIELAVTRRGLEEQPASPLIERIRNNFHATRSGDIYIAQAPYWYFLEPDPIAVMHGSPWAYDTHVPIIFAGPGIAATTVYRSVEPTDVAPTLSAALGMSPPASSEGVILREALELKR